MRFGEAAIRLRAELILQAGAVIFLFAFFAFFAGKGLWAGFTGDDLMNLHQYMKQGFAGVVLSMLCFWSTAFRPLGGLFYLTLYNIFGFNPFPFRIVCFILLLANLYLAYRFIVRLSSSRATGVLAALLLCYHAWFVDLYYSSGTVYDLLCFFFYYSAFIYYLKIRDAEHRAVKNWIIFLVLYLCALNAKEMAVTLPLFIAIYEISYHMPRWSVRGLWRWIVDRGTGFLLSGLATIAYIFGKLLLKGSLIENPAYRLNIKPTIFLDSFHLYLNPLFYQDHVFRDPNTIQLMVVMLAFAIWRRSRHLLFSWFFLLLSGLPVFFMAHHSAFFMYIPSVGWALYIAGTIPEFGQMLKGLQSRLFGKRISSPHVSMLFQVAVFCAMAVFLALVHPDESRKTLAHFQKGQLPIMEMSREIKQLQPDLPRGSSVYFANDPYPADDWGLLFLTRLLYHDMTLDVGRGKPGAVLAAKPVRYHAAFDYRNGHFVAISPPEPNDP
jgi:hypothetical protein